MSCFDHVIRLTDDTGIMEHALGRIPRRKEGYSTDDQARALWMCLEWLDLTGEEDAEKLYRLIDVYLSFLLWVQKENGHFHNNIAYDRTREVEMPSDDCLGRCLWAGAQAVVRLRDPHRRIAAETLLEKALTQIPGLRYPRGWAYAMAATSFLILNAGRTDLNPNLEMLTQKLLDSYRMHASPGWSWFEPVVSYSSGLLPWGLLSAYEVNRDPNVLASGLESLDFLIQISTNESGQIRPAGNQGWCTRESRAVWDQQPIDVMKLCLAAAKAYQITGEMRYRAVAANCREWFYGANDAAVPLADPREGSCCDGIGKTGVNLNQGAESTIAYLITEVIWKKME